MSIPTKTCALADTVAELSRPESLKGLFHQHREGYPLPSTETLREIIQLSRSILFPGYFGKSQIHVSTLVYQIGVEVERLHELLADQVLAGLCFHCDSCEGDCNRERQREHAEEIATCLIRRLPDLRRILATDVTAAYNGDPAAESFAEIAVECVTNAVRHGYATRIQFHLFHNDCWRMTVTDNGIPPAGPIREGGGIGGMRRRIARLGGTLDLYTVPRFRIELSVSKEAEGK